MQVLCTPLGILEEASSYDSREPSQLRHHPHQPLSDVLPASTMSWIRVLGIFVSYDWRSFG